MNISTKIVAIFFAFIFSVSSLFSAGKNNKWLLNDFPEFDGGVKSSALYDAGSGREPDWMDEDESNNNYMQAVYNVSHKRVRDYCDKLAKNGFEKIYENQVGYNLFYGFAKGEQQLYITFNIKLGEVRIMDNSCSDRIDEFGYCEAGDKTTAVFQYNFPYYDPDINNDDDIYARNGMCYVIRLSDNKLVVIDGGATNQASEENVKKFVAFLHEITGTQAGDKIDIAMWYGTHPHSDHILFFSKVLVRYPNEFNIERLAYNYQSYSNCEYNHRADWFRQQTNQMFPEAKYMKVRTGQKWNLADVSFNVICTHEETVDAKTGVLPATDANDCSSVLRIKINKTTFLFTGDTDTIMQDAMLKRYTESYLHSDVMQAPHHLINTVRKLYPAVAPEYLLAPQSKYRSENYLKAYTVAVETVKPENIFYASQGTYCLVPNADGSILISHTAPDYTPFDGSDFSYDF